MILNHQENIPNMHVLHQEAAQCFAVPSFWIPDLINLSAWIEHAPFAFWLVNVTCPSTIVELGVHHGFSYFAFCQTVKQLGLATRCYAIDTWQGDEHSGFYAEDVFNTVHAYNQQKYSGFSQLIQSTFDDALGYFLDKSIDILHIDGRHFYEDVKHDFTTWLPKLSDRAVVLIHDINVKKNHFGVFKFWEEIRQLHPHFEFIHGHGLGVLGVGKTISPKLNSLFEATNQHKEAEIRYIYSRLGASLTERYQLATQTEQAAQLRLAESLSRSEVNIFREKLEKSETHLHTLSEENRKQQTEILRLHEQLKVFREVSKNEAEKQKIAVNLENKEREILQLKNQLSITENALTQREQAIEQLVRTVKQIYSSRFWRFSLPLRKVLQIFS